MYATNMVDSLEISRMDTQTSCHIPADLSQQLEELRLNVSLAFPHELRTPLNVILGFSEYLLSQGPERLPEADTILQMQMSIHENALRLQRLVENYLLYVHLKLIEHDVQKQRAEMWESRERLDSRSFIASVAAHKAQHLGRHQDLQLHLADAELSTSSKSLHKIVEELLDNACKFSAPGSPIRVTTEASDGQWILRIHDDGYGMSERHIENVGAFMQFDRSYYEQQGSGLGLALAALLVHLNHGKLHIESVPGQGTTVAVTFQGQPVAEASARSLNHASAKV
jgi:signal transduction histidine kinase